MSLFEPQYGTFGPHPWLEGRGTETEGRTTKGGVTSVPVEDDGMLAMAQEQGWVPAGCYMDGQLLFALQKRGEDPCNVCNGHRLRCQGRPRLKGTA